MHRAYQPAPFPTEWRRRESNPRIVPHASSFMAGAAWILYDRHERTVITCVPPYYEQRWGDA
jgi:hypothetical protein